MPNRERVRDSVSALPGLDYFVQRLQAGWSLVAVEWERRTEGSADLAPPAADGQAWTEEIPYGLRVSDDCTRLVECPPEMEIVVLALDRIVDDCPLSQVAEELNRRGYRTRDGGAWAPEALFHLLPRMIQMGPRLFGSEQWQTRRARILRLQG